MVRCGLLLTVLALSLTAPADGASLLRNGDFEAGSSGWILDHAWYAQPPGSGTSSVVVAPGEGREGSHALKIVGGGKRGIAMQLVACSPGRYRVSGWVRCEKLTGNAGILVEWMRHDGPWMRGDGVGEVTGTQDWQFVEQVFEAPFEARSVHFDLLTAQPNQGTVWYDEVAMERLPNAAGPPPAPTVSVTSPDRAAGELRVTWDAAQTAAGGGIRLLAWVSPTPFETTAGRAPNAVADVLAGGLTLPGLQVGTAYQIRCAVVDGDARQSPLSAAATPTAADRRRPRPGLAWAERAGAAVTVGWSPHLLDEEVASLEIAAGDQVLQTVDLSAAWRAPRPLPCTAPWATATVTTAATTLTVRAVGRNGQRSDDLAVPVAAALTAAGPGPWQAALADPHAQVPRDAASLPTGLTALQLVALRGETEGRQILLRTTAPVERLRAVPSDLRQVGGDGRLAAHWIGTHFVNYVAIEKNSRATPAEELVWKGPADYPDELSDDRERELPAGQVQPIYLRVTVPRDTSPGIYRGSLRVESVQGRQEWPLELTVSTAELPAVRKLGFVYWFQWDAVCKRWGVEPQSADGWQVLRRLGQLMTSYHQNTVIVPLSLVRVWVRDDGGLECDFTAFDRFVDTMRSAGVDRLFCLSHIGGRETGDWECPTFVAHGFTAHKLANGEPVALRTLDVLAPVAAHVDQRGWTDQFAVHVADEPIPRNIDSWRQLSRQVKAAAPKLRRIDAIHVPDLGEDLEIQVPQLNYFMQWRDAFRAQQAAGREVWFYVAWVPQGAFPNRMIDSSALKPRVLHWLNALGETTGYLHWALNWWDIPLTSLESPGDQYIVWPSTTTIANSSLRYESERDGLEEAELLLELRQRLIAKGLTPAAAQEHLAQLARPAVRGVTDYERSWQALEGVRVTLLRALETLR
ncbi:MAG: DUF4091 domain-containing protein [Fimbriimonadaceae bacterium]|nr:DUF4091 domain-containing protein [Fimbriimonadaceae bacterium]